METREWAVKEVKKHKVETADKGKIDNGKEKEDIEKVAFIREASIHTIFGGSHAGGSGKNAMERYVREAKQPLLTNVNHLTERPPKMFKREDIHIIIAEADVKWVHHPMLMRW